MTTQTLPPREYDDFESECAEAFLRLSSEARAINRRGYDSERAYQNKITAMDAVLDQLLTHREVQAGLATLEEC